MVDEEYGLKAVSDGENRPALLLLDHGHILAARGAGVNFRAGRFGRYPPWLSRIRAAYGMLLTTPMRRSPYRRPSPWP